MPNALDYYSLLQPIFPNWNVLAHVRALSTTRFGGVSVAPFDALNLGDHVDDNVAAVAENRRRLATILPSEPLWLNQVHGTHVLNIDALPPERLSEIHTADAVYTCQAGVVCAVMTADCLPVLFADRMGRMVAAAHAGWRGLCEGVLEATLAQFVSHTMKPDEVVVWLGPAISVSAFEVGAEVREAFLQRDIQAAAAFHAHPEKRDKFFADLYMLARQRLKRCGVSAIFGGEYCTYSDVQRFFSYRRDGKTGRMASCIWLDVPRS